MGNVRMTRSNALAVLGLTNGTNDADIKSAYRRLAHTCHPDKHRNDPKAEERFIELNAAYEVLTEGPAETSGTRDASFLDILNEVDGNAPTAAPTGYVEAKPAPQSTKAPPNHKPPPKKDDAFERTLRRDVRGARLPEREFLDILHEQVRARLIAVYPEGCIDDARTIAALPGENERKMLVLRILFPLLCKYGPQKSSEHAVMVVRWLLEAGTLDETEKFEKVVKAMANFKPRACERNLDLKTAYEFLSRLDEQILAKMPKYAGFLRSTRVDIGYLTDVQRVVAGTLAITHDLNAVMKIKKIEMLVSARDAIGSYLNALKLYFGKSEGERKNFGEIVETMVAFKTVTESVSYGVPITIVNRPITQVTKEKLAEVYDVLSSFEVPMLQTIRKYADFLKFNRVEIANASDIRRVIEGTLAITTDIEAVMKLRNVYVMVTPADPVGSYLNALPIFLSKQDDERFKRTVKAVAAFRPVKPTSAYNPHEVFEFFSGLQDDRLNEMERYAETLKAAGVPMKGVADIRRVVDGTIAISERMPRAGEIGSIGRLVKPEDPIGSYLDALRTYAPEGKIDPKKIDVANKIGSILRLGTPTADEIPTLRKRVMCFKGDAVALRDTIKKLCWREPFRDYPDNLERYEGLERVCTLSGENGFSVNYIGNLFTLIGNVRLITKSNHPTITTYVDVAEVFFRNAKERSIDAREVISKFRAFTSIVTMKKGETWKTPEMQEAKDKLKDKTTYKEGILRIVDVFFKSLPSTDSSLPSTNAVTTVETETRAEPVIANQ